jgi:hypothetical protein
MSRPRSARYASSASATCWRRANGRKRARVALVAALVVARLLDPASKLTTARLLDATTATSSLGTVLALSKVDEKEIYDVLDWLLAQQGCIETALARCHLSHGTLVLYDVRKWSRNFGHGKK